MVLGLISKFSKLSLATAITALTPVSCYYMTSFNYGGKEARNVGLTCRCHLQDVFFFKFFFKGDSHCVPQPKRDGFSCLIIITLIALGKPSALTV